MQLPVVAECWAADAASVVFVNLQTQELVKITQAFATVASVD